MIQERAEAASRCPRATSVLSTLGIDQMARDRTAEPETMWIQLSPIKGDALDTEHKDWVVVTGYGFGAARGQTGHSFSSFSIEKYVDCASPDLMIFVADKTKKISTAKLAVKDNNDNTISVEIEMTERRRQISEFSQSKLGPAEGNGDTRLRPNKVQGR